MTTNPQAQNALELHRRRNGEFGTQPKHETTGSLALAPDYAGAGTAWSSGFDEVYPDDGGLARCHQVAEQLAQADANKALNAGHHLPIEVARDTHRRRVAAAAQQVDGLATYVFENAYPLTDEEKAYLLATTDSDLDADEVEWCDGCDRNTAHNFHGCVACAERAMDEPDYDDYRD